MWAQEDTRKYQVRGSEPSEHALKCACHPLMMTNVLSYLLYLSSVYPPSFVYLPFIVYCLSVIFCPLKQLAAENWNAPSFMEFTWQG